MIENLAGIFVLLGSLVIFVSAIGVYRLPDAYSRGHALGKGMTLGISLMLIGYWIYSGTQTAGLKVLIAIFFQFLTIPVASHLLTLIGFLNHMPRYRENKEDPEPEDFGV